MHKIYLYNLHINGQKKKKWPGPISIFRNTLDKIQHPFMTKNIIDHIR